MIEGAVDHLLKELGETLDDYALTLAADGKTTRVRGIAQLDNAQRHIRQRLLADGVRPSVFARRATLTQDSSDEYVWHLPIRTLGVLSVEEGDDYQYQPVYSRNRSRELGFIVERRKSTTGGNFLPVIRFWNCRPIASATIYAWVLEEPVRLCVADGTFTATTATFGTTSKYGNLVDTDDYLNGAEIGVVTGTVAGQVRQVSDYTGSTHQATVATWSTTPTTDDDISTLIELPRPAWRPVILEAARRVIRVNREFQDRDKDILKELATTSMDAARILNKQALADASGPRQVVRWVH